MDTGAIIACGYTADNIVRAVQIVIMQHNESAEKESESFVPNDYRITNTSQRVVNLIVGTAKLSNQWDGIREYSTD